MAWPKQNVDGVPGSEQEAFFEGSAHARAHPVTGFESSLFVVHYFVGKQKHWLATGSDYFGSLGVGDYGVKDYPFLDDAEGHMPVVHSGCLKGFIKGEFEAH